MPMTFNLRIWIRVVALIALLGLAAIAFVEERGWRQEQRELKATLAAAQSALQAAEARERERDAQLVNTLAQIAAQKRSVVTPQQALVELPKVLPLPAPIAPLVAPSPEAYNESKTDVPQKPVVVLPTEDLKPLYDFALDCKACQAKLTAAQNDLADERSKGAALTQERDAALKAARGGGVWRRVGRAAKWLLIGAVAGAALAHAH